jgi:hypothetical protein
MIDPSSPRLRRAGGEKGCGCGGRGYNVTDRELIRRLN